MYVIGLDYGSDSARAIVVDAQTGKTLASSVCEYPRWKKGLYCNAAINQYRQHPLDYIEALIGCVRGALAQCPKGTAEKVVGIGIDTTGSTPALTDCHGTPLALLPGFEDNPNAMFVLWKDHTALEEADRINALCKKWEIDYTKYSGGRYSSEWFFAKALHTMNADPLVKAAAYSIVEHCDWMGALLTGCHRAEDIVRSRCAAGHKAMWNEQWGGLPSQEFLSSLDPCFDGMRERLYTETFTADKPVGYLSPEWAEKLGLSTSVVVSGTALDCHFGAVGACIREHSLVRIIGTSTCDILVSSPEALGGKLIEGICGQVDGSVVPGKVGLEAGQAAFGDVYAWFKRLIMEPLKALLGEGETFEKADKDFFPMITALAEKVSPEESTVYASDWFNGRRTPFADERLTGTISGLNLGSNAAMLFRALVEATAFGSRAIVERYKEEGIQIESAIGIGGIALKNPFVMQILSDVLNMPIKVCKTDQACALGGAMFAATAAGVYSCVEHAQKAMDAGIAKEYIPSRKAAATYERLYKRYKTFCK